MAMPFAGIAHVRATMLQLKPVALAFSIAVGLSGAALASSTPAPADSSSVANPELWPGRNVALGRQSTPAEVDALQGPNACF